MDDRRDDAGSFSGDLRDPVRPVKKRLEWADAAKGACIVLVVLWHVIMKDYPQVDWRVSTPFLGAWGSAGELLLPLRMPLFFAISGFFAANAVRRPWGVIGRTKVAKFLYLYVLWLCVHTALLSLVPDFGTERAGGVPQFLAQLTITPSNLWYLQALAIYFVVAKVSLRVPPPVMLAAAFLLSATAAAELVPTPGDRGGPYQNLVFFLAGLYGKSLMERVADAANWLRFAAIAVPYLGILVVIEHFGFKAWYGLWPAVSFAAVFLGVTLFSLVTRWAAVTSAMTSIGRRTLPIYVMHMPNTRPPAPDSPQPDRAHPRPRTAGTVGRRTRRADRGRHGDLSCTAPDSAHPVGLRPASAAQTRTLAEPSLEPTPSQSQMPTQPILKSGHE